MAGYSPDTVQFIECHQTGTPVGDPEELKSLKAVWNEYPMDKRSVGLGSVKCQIGHLTGAAGAASLIKCALGLYHKMLPPNINYEKPNSELAKDDHPFYVVTEPAPWPGNKGKPRRADVSAFGFGGTNFHMTLEEYDPEFYLGIKKEEEDVIEEEIIPEPSRLMYEPFIFEGDSIEELISKIRGLDAAGGKTLKEIAYARGSGRER
jgi:acyl transferase domain-containing protein